MRAPTGVRFSAVAAGRGRLVWTAVSGAQSYRVYEAPTQRLVVATYALYAVVAARCYWVTAVGGGIESIRSTEACAPASVQTATPLVSGYVLTPVASAAPDSARKSPARSKYEAVTLARGVTHDATFEQWASQVSPLPPRRASLAASFRQGSAQLRAGNLHGAAAAYELAVRAKPDDYAALYNLAIVHLRSGSHDRALLELERAEKLARTRGDRSAAATIERTLLAVKNGDYPK